MSNLASLAVISGLSLNLVLQTGLGIRDIVVVKEKPVSFHLFQWFVHFITVFVLWLFWTYIICPLGLGFFEYFLLFPIISLIYYGLEVSFVRILPDFSTLKKNFTASSGVCATITAILMALRLADGITEAFVLSFFFAAGAFLASLLLCAIRKRLTNERIPQKFRGTPLLLLSMGLLSLVFNSVAFVLLFH